MEEAEGLEAQQRKISKSWKKLEKRPKLRSMTRDIYNKARHIRVYIMAWHGMAMAFSYVPYLFHRVIIYIERTTKRKMAR